MEELKELLTEILGELKELNEKVKDVEYNTWMSEANISKIKTKLEEALDGE
ncbi:hypothetical protein [Paraclostridium bifermentans]|uniref:hypothetical protein n=1 Tax=Paraclostridium bifermentans TaxID=1490 RepID=UPI00189C5ACA|nr:hypothetical protein [Paraclostridium bifermentans]